MRDILEHVIVPVLRRLNIVKPGMYSHTAALLICGTIAQESRGGRNVRQDGNLPARGICQMEPIRYNEVDAWLGQKANLDLGMAVRDLRLIAGPQGIDQLQGNAYLAVAYCRVGYWMRSDPLPAPDDREGIWLYYKKHWNSYAGTATRDDFMNNWVRYMPGASDIHAVLV